MRKANAKALKALSREFVQLCRELELIGLQKQFDVLGKSRDGLVGFRLTVHIATRLAGNTMQSQLALNARAHALLGGQRHRERRLKQLLQVLPVALFGRVAMLLEGIEHGGVVEADTRR